MDEARPGSNDPDEFDFEGVNKAAVYDYDNGFYPISTGPARGRSTLRATVVPSHVTKMDLWVADKRTPFRGRDGYVNDALVHENHRLSKWAERQGDFALAGELEMMVKEGIEIAARSVMSQLIADDQAKYEELMGWFSGPYYPQVADEGKRQVRTLRNPEWREEAQRASDRYRRR